MIVGLPPDPDSAPAVLQAAGAAGLAVDVAPYYCAGKALSLVARQLAESGGLAVTTRVPRRDVRPDAPVTDAYPAGWILRSVRRQLAETTLPRFCTVLLERWLPSWELDTVLPELREVTATGLADQAGIALTDSDPGALWPARDAVSGLWLEGDGSLVSDDFLANWAPGYRESGAITQARAPYFHGWLCSDTRSAQSYGGQPRGALFRSVEEALVARRTEMSAVARQLGTDLPVLALAFVRSRLGPDGRVVVGCRTPEQLARTSSWWQQAEVVARRLR